MHFPYYSSALTILLWLLFFMPTAFADDYLSPKQQEIANRLSKQLILTNEEKAWLADNKIIRVGIDSAYAPYTYLSHDLRFEGLAADYLAILAKVLNVQFQVQADLNWSQVLTAAQQKQVDLIATASRTEKRETFLTFTDFFIATPMVIMSRDDKVKLMEKTGSLNGHTVALVKDYASSQKVLKRYPNLIPYYVETPLQALQAIAAGEAEAYIGVLGVNIHLAKEHGLTNLVVAERFDLQPSGQRFAIRNDWPELKNIMDKALLMMRANEKNALLDRWIPGIALPAEEYSGLVLTSEEKAFIAEKGSTTMCVDPNWMPFEKIDANGKHIGIAADYMQMFSRMLGLEVKLVPTESWTQSEAFAQARKCDLLSFLNHSERRAEYLNFTDPYVEAPVVLVAQDKVTYIDGLKSLSGRTFAMVKGYVYEDVIRNDYPDIKIVYVDSMDDALKKISEGKIYATIGSLYIITSQIQKLGLTDLKIAGHTGMTNQFRVGVRNDDPMLLQLFQKAVSAREQQAENEILRRWVSVRLEQSVDYSLIWKLAVVALAVVLLLIYRQTLVSRYNRQLMEKNAELERLSRTDPLTGAFNRMKIDEVLSYELEQAKRYQHNFSVIIVDIDHFKQINDTYGHQVGDLVLKGFSDIISQCIRKSDTLGRWGGEEFVIICPQSDQQQTHTLAEKLRTRILDYKLEGLDQITASFGVTSYQKGDLEKDLINRADGAMYQAKNAGRNKVCVQ